MSRDCGNPTSEKSTISVKDDRYHLVDNVFQCMSKSPEGAKAHNNSFELAETNFDFCMTLIKDTLCQPKNFLVPGNSICSVMTQKTIFCVILIKMPIFSGFILEVDLNASKSTDAQVLNGSIQRPSPSNGNQVDRFVHRKFLKAASTSLMFRFFQAR